MTDMPAKYKLVDSLLNSCAEVLAQGRIFEYFQPDIHLIRSLEEGRYDGILITDDVSRDPNWPHRPHQLAERQFLPLTHSERVKQLHGLYFAVKLMEKDATGQSVVWDLKSQPEQRDTVDFYIICFSRLPNMCAIVPKNYLYPEHRQATKMEEAVKRYGTTWEHENPRIRLQMECVDSNLAENVPPSLLPFLVPMNILSLVMDDVREAVNNRRPFTNRFTEVKYSHWSLEPKQLVSAMPVTRVSFYQKVDDIRMDLQHPSSPFHMELSMYQPLLCDFKLSFKNLEEQYYIEYKHGMWTGAPDNISHVMHRDLRHSFASDAAWDYFWTDGAFNQEQQFFLIPRDKLPHSWWITIPDTKVEQMQSTNLSEFFVDRRDQNWQEKVATIVKRYGKAKSKPPHTDHLTGYQNVGRVFLSLDSEKSSAHDAIKPPAVVEKQQPAEVYSDKALSSVFNHLNRLCASNMRGMFIFVGDQNPCGDMCFVDYKWSDADRQTFREYGRPPLTLEGTSLSPYQPCLWIKNHVLIRSEGLESQLVCPNVMSLYAGHANFVLLRDNNEDMRNSKCNFYLIPSIMLDKRYERFHHLPHRASDNTLSPLPLELKDIDPQPSLRIDGESMIQFLLDVLGADPEKKITPFWLPLWSSAKLYADKFTSNIHHGMQAMAEELWMWG